MRSTGNRHRWLGSTALLLAALSLAGSTLWAGTTARLSVPAPGKLPLAGLRMEVDATWVQGNGYHPVRVTVSRTGRAVGDREILVEFYANAWGNRTGNQCVSQYITLPEGTAEVTEVLLVPQNQQWQSAQIDVWEDGRELEELCVENFGIAPRQQWTEASPKILLIDSAAPAPHQRETLLRTGSAGGPATGQRTLPQIWGLANFLPNEFAVAGPTSSRDVLSHVSQLDEIELAPPSDLPTTWLGYTCLDLVFVSQEDLQSLVAEDSLRWQALRSWTMAGGTLCVYGMGDRYQRLRSLEDLCGMASLSAETDAYLGWTVPNQDRLNRDVGAFQAIRQSHGQTDVFPDANESTSTELGPSDRLSPPRDTQKDPFFVFRPWALGTVVAFGPGTPFPGSQPQWACLFNSLGDRRFMWYQRHGVSLNRENEGFWTFLIPGVGTAPVGAYRVLITLFIVGIGPVNYVLLRRWGRLHWLLVTVPAGALVVAAALFGYALVADGLGAQVRFRSLTHIDQQQGQAICWSRQSYYAGMAPSRGLSFPTDTAVYPLQQLPESYYRPGSTTSRRLLWDEQQRLQRGYITSRVTTQFITVRSRRSNAGLRITESTDPRPTLTAENQLGADVRLLFLRDKSGNYFRGQVIPEGGRRQLSPTDKLDGLVKVLARNRPVVPKGFVPDDYKSAVNFMGPYRYWSSDRMVPPPSLATSIMEHTLSQLQSRRLADEDRLAPGSYVAVVGRPAELPVGLADAEEVASFHVITGTW